jgi:hypothetical protein
MKYFQKGEYMKVNQLAEAIILQSIEDLWDDDHREECIRFFTGEDFRTCAAIAGMDTGEQIKILKMLSRVIKGMRNPAKDKKKAGYGCLSSGSESGRELVRA